MGQSWVLHNLTDRVREQYGGKLGETIWHKGTDLIELLKQWRNPFPDLVVPLESINRARAAHGTEAQVVLVQESPFLSLPDELFIVVASHLYQYRDYLSLTETCMFTLQRLAPITTEVRCNMATAMGPAPHPCRSWSGKRIVWLGEYTVGKGWLMFKEHARKQIHAAATRRGCLELEDDIAREMSSLLDIGCPHEDWDDDEDEDTDPASDQPDETIPAPPVCSADDSPSIPPQTTRQIDSYKCESRLYRCAVPTKKERRTKLDELLEGSHFDLEKRILAQLPVRHRYNKLFKKIQKRKSRPGHTARSDWKRLSHDWKQDEKLERLCEEMYAQEDPPRRNPNGEDYRAWREKYRRLKIVNTQPCRRDQREVPYRIVNLDTLEHLDSEVIGKHCPEMRDHEGSDFELDIDFVLACQIAYSTDTSSSMCYKPDDLAQARWAGHRLVYEEDDGPQTLDRPTTDVSLEMLAMAVRVLISDGFSFFGYDDKGCKLSDDEGWEVTDAESGSDSDESGNSSEDASGDSEDIGNDGKESGSYSGDSDSDSDYIPSGSSKDDD